jgi:hypothetical protein
MRQILLSVTLLLLAGCTTSAPMADVTRFHLGQPIPVDTVQIVSPAADITTQLNISAAKSAIATELEGLGFRPVDVATSAYIASFRMDETSQQGPPKPSPFSVGIGGGTGGGNVGVGGSVNVPVGSSRPGDTIRTTLLILDIKRRSDNSVVWEGRASRITNAKSANPLPGLVHALFTAFPGPSGQMVQVPTK